MRLRPFDLEAWALKCHRCTIDLDASGAPAPYSEAEWKKVAPFEMANNEAEMEHNLIGVLSAIYGVRREQIALSQGAQQANFLFLYTLLSHSDMVAVELPGYTPIQLEAEMVCETRNFKRHSCMDYRPEMSDIQGLLDQGAKVIAMTNLHNPSAAVLSDDDQRAILEEARKSDSYVLSDEIYKEMTYSSPPKSVCQLGENGIAVSGLTKLFGLRSLRIGWLVGPEEIMQKIELFRMTTSNRLPASSLYYAAEALKRRDYFRERALRRARMNLRVLEDWLEEEKRVHCRLPDGGLMVLLHLPQGLDDLRLAEIIREKFRTAVGPGTYFGAPGCIRVTFSLESERFAQGLSNISSSLDSAIS